MPRFPGCHECKVEAMAIDEVDPHRTVSTGPGGSEVVQRILVLAFGLIQLVIGARIVLLLLDARTTNGLVSGINNLSQIFVAPFEGILRTNSLSSSGSVLDVAAVLALVAWTVVELVAVSAVAIFRRDPA
jgi:preprotein translocase subunit SecY